MRLDDVIAGLDGKTFDMEPIEFQMFMRLSHKAGETAQLVVVRGSRRLQISVKLK